MAKSPPRLRAGIYIRLSVDHDQQTSTERQEADCRALAEAKGFEVAKAYPDVGVSGYRAVDRPQYDQLLDDVRAGQIDVIVVWKLDRLTRRGIRSIAPLLDLLEETGASLVSVQDSIDTSTAMGEGVLGLLASLAKQESENISTRTRSAKAHQAQQGKWGGGGRRPFGYRKTDDGFAVDPDEARHLRKGAERHLAGESLRSIVADWNERGIVTTTGAKWTTAKLGRTLRSPFHAGMRRHRDQTFPGSWPGIFTLDEHDALKAAAGHHRPAVVKNHLLTGIIYCGECGSRMACKTTKRFGRQYACRGCERLVVNADNLEGFMDAAIGLVLDSPKIRAALAAKDDRATVAELTAAITEDRDALRQLSADHYSDRLISRDEYLAARGPITERLEANEAKLARLERSTVESTEDPVALWESADPDARREVVRLLVDRVTVKPTTVRGRSKFDDDRIDVEWRV
jgi:site-specific DNA recombinase